MEKRGLAQNPPKKQIVMYHKKGNNMSRPTTDPKTKTIKLRISDDLLREIGEGNVSERVRELIRRGLNEPYDNPRDYVPQKDIDIGKIRERCSGEADEFVGRGLWENVSILANFEVEQLKSNVPQNSVPQIDEEVLKDIEGMSRFFGLSLNEFMGKLRQGMEEGSVLYENGRFVVQNADVEEMEQIKEMCRDRNISLKKTLEAVKQMIMRS